MQKRLLYALCAMLVMALLAVSSLLAQPDPEFGFLRGTVKMDDGTPCKGMAVTVTIAGTGYNLTTNDEGAFTGIMRAGTGTITAETVTQEITMLPATPIEVNLVLKKVGVMLTCVYPDNTPAQVYINNAMYKTKTGTNSVNARPFGGMYWLSSVPADATELLVLVNFNGNFSSDTRRCQWKFDNTQELRTLTVTIPKPVDMSITVVDSDGKPVINTSLRCRVEYDQRYFNGDLWTGEPKIRKNTNNVPLTTDGNGLLKMPRIFPGSYTISARGGTQAGSPVNFTVGEDGKVDLVKYELSIKPHPVTQTIFSADGKPASNTKVTAVYAMNGQVTQESAMSDAQGKVAWKNLPPGRILITGAGIPLGVLTVAVNTTEVTTPLPPPGREENSTQLRFLLPGLGQQQQLRLVGAVQSNTNSNSFSNAYYNSESKAHAVNTYARAGETVSLFLMTQTTPPKVAELRNVLVPYGDGEELAWPLTLEDAVVVTGHLQQADGTPIPAVSSMRIVQDDAGLMGNPLINNDYIIRAGILQPRFTADGQFTALLPAAGKYRVLVDLYDERTPSPEGMTFTAKPGANDITVTLPAPLTTTIGGSEIVWLHQHAPANPQRLIVGAGAAQMPVFGPREQLLAFWYRPQADKLVVWRNTTGAPLAQTYTLRLTRIVPQRRENSDYYTDMRLLPLLPVARNDAYSYGNPVNLANRTESQVTYLQGGSALLANLWTAPYLVATSNSNSTMAQVTPPADGNPEVLLPAELPQTPGGEGGTRYIRLQFPALNYAELRKTANQYLQVSYDVPMPRGYGNQTIYAGNLEGREQSTSVPANATKITITWFGVGTISDVPIPKPNADGNSVLITLPKWETGGVFSGQVVQADGKPYAKMQITVKPGTSVNDNGNDGYRVTTDDEGKFSVKGIGAGLVFLTTGEYYDQGGAWAVAIPEKGLEGQVFRMSANPMRLNLNLNTATAWWLPDTGKPQRLPVRGNMVAMHEIPTGPGALWAVSQENGAAIYQRITLGPGEIRLQANSLASTPIGIYFPLEMDCLPTSITVTGKGTLEGISLTITNLIWQASAVLNTVVGQIDALPPGDYTLKVNTWRGPVEAPLTVGANGAKINLTYPPKPIK